MQMVDMRRTGSRMEDAELHVVAHVAMIDIRRIVGEKRLGRFFGWRRERGEVVALGLDLLWRARFSGRELLLDRAFGHLSANSALVRRGSYQGVRSIFILRSIGREIHNHGRIAHRPRAQEKFLEL